MKTDYGVTQFDFVFLNRSEYGLPSHVPLLKLLEGEEVGTYFERAMLCNYYSLVSFFMKQGFPEHT